MPAARDRSLGRTQASGRDEAELPLQLACIPRLKRATGGHEVAVALIMKPLIPTHRRSRPFETIGHLSPGDESRNLRNSRIIFHLNAIDHVRETLDAIYRRKQSELDTALSHGRMQIGADKRIKFIQGNPSCSLRNMEFKCEIR